MFVEQFDILVFQLLRELISRRVPNAEVVDQRQNALLMLGKALVGLGHAPPNRFPYVRAGSLERGD